MSATNHIISIPDIDHDFATNSLGETFYEAMQTYKDRTAQIDADTGEEENYGHLLERCIRLALTLQERGLGNDEDDMVGLCTTNHLDSGIPFIAAQFIGVKAVSWDPREPIDELSYAFDLVKPNIIFITPEIEEKIELAKKNAKLENLEIVVFGESSRNSEFSDFQKPHPKEDEFKVKQVDCKETAAILFSSGTSGLPKGVCLSHFNLQAVLPHMQHADDIDYELLEREKPFVTFPFRFMTYSSLFWVSALSMFLSTILTGSTRILSREYIPEKVLPIIAKYKVLSVFLGPAQIVDICKLGRPDNLNITGPLRIITGGASISGDQIKQLREMLPQVDIFQSYALTEVTGITCLFQAINKRHRELFQERPGSCGLPVAGVSYKVVDPETKEILGPHQVGELRLKTKLIMNGYYKRDSSDVFDEDGWFCTGDLVYYDDDRCFYVVDRLKDMFKYRSQQVNPPLMEAVLIQHPDVVRAAVIGIPHEEDGCHPMGLVVLREGSTVTSEQLLDYFDPLLIDKCKLRAGLKVVKSLPMTSTGKLRKKFITNLVLKGEL